MTVAHVYWHFDVMCAHIRMTNPFGSGDETASGAGGGASGGGDVIEQKTGFGLWSSINGSDMQRRKVGVDRFSSIDDVRAKNPHLADFLSDIKKGAFD